MKFNPYNWNEVKHDQTINVEKGRVQLRLSKPAAVYVTAQGYQTLVGHGTTFDFEVTEEVSVNIEASASTRWFIYQPGQTAKPAEGTVFTNIDRMIQESGTITEVKRALRQLEIERRSALREIRHASNAFTKRKTAAEKMAEPAIEPAIEPVAEPAIEPAPTE